MEALFIVINDLEHVQDVLETLIELNVHGATILDSQGLAQAILKTGLGDLFHIGPYSYDDYPHNKTIVSVMKQEKVKEVVSAVREILSETARPGVGFMFSIPVSNIYTIGGK